MRTVFKIMMSLMLLVSMGAFVGCELSSKDDEKSSLISEMMYITGINHIAYQEGDLGITYLTNQGEYEVIPTTSTSVVIQRDSCSGFDNGTISDIPNDAILEVTYDTWKIDYSQTPAKIRPTNIVGFRRECVIIDPGCSEGEEENE